MEDSRPPKKINWHREPDGRIRLFERGTKGRKWPREECRPFDAMTDEQVEAWTQNYNAQVHIQAAGVGTSGRLSALIQEWKTHLETKGRHYETVSEKVRHAYRAGRYFEALTDNIRLWPQHSINLATHLLSEEHSLLETAKTQNDARAFWEWLKKHKRMVSGALDLDQVVGYAVQNQTPLQFTVTPEQVLKFARETPIFEFKVAVLVAFFAGLRPQEVYALKRDQFYSKDIARNSPSGEVMRSIGLYDGLMVDVRRNRGKRSGDVRDPKKGSFGLVSVHNKEAAAYLVSLIGKMDPDIVLFKYTNSYYQHDWRKDGYPGLTVRDLRRAGIYWLGHFSQIKLESLKNWARHKKIQTTSLYFRQPYASPTTTQDVLELDDVS